MESLKIVALAFLTLAMLIAGYFLGMVIAACAVIFFIVFGIKEYIEYLKMPKDNSD